MIMKYPVEILVQNKSEELRRYVWEFDVSIGEEKLAQRVKEFLYDYFLYFGLEGQDPFWYAKNIEGFKEFDWGFVIRYDWTAQDEKEYEEECKERDKEILNYLESKGCLC